MVQGCDTVETAGRGAAEHCESGNRRTGESGNRKLTLSDHFCKQWRAYFQQPPPNVHQVMCLIGRAIWIQRCKLLYEADGTPHKQLGTYWIPDRNIILKVDWDRKKVVTVLTPGSRRGAKTAVGSKE